jgi:hypothetical protein
MRKKTAFYLFHMIAGPFFCTSMKNIFLKMPLLGMRPHSHRDRQRQGMSLLEPPHKKINQRRL